MRNTSLLYHLLAKRYCRKGGAGNVSFLPWLDQFSKLVFFTAVKSLPLNNSLHKLKMVTRYYKHSPFLCLFVLNILSNCGFDIPDRSDYNCLIGLQTSLRPDLTVSTLVR
jgi:hypothetical protein